MASTFTPNLNLEVPARGDYVNTWDLAANPDYQIIDDAIGGQTTLDVGAGGTFNLTKAQAAKQIFLLNGSLSGDAVILFPAMGGRKIIFPNVACNGHRVYLRGGGGTDNIGIYFDLQFAIPIPIVVAFNRVYWDYSGSRPGQLVERPTNLPVHGELRCDGGGYSTTQYDLLFDILGYSYGGSGGGFNVPDYRGWTNVCADDLGTGSAGRFFNMGPNGTFGQLQHGITQAEMPTHNHGSTVHGHGAYQDAHSHGGVVTGATPFGGAFQGTISGANLVFGRTDAQQPGVHISDATVYTNDVGGNQPIFLVQPSKSRSVFIRW